MPLPPLILAGKPARAHTQGLEIVAGAYFATARREDVQPKRALLLQTGPDRPGWASWDITADTGNVEGGAAGLLDHPGGLQASGGNLWIPLAESRRGGRSWIRAYALADLEPGKSPRVVVEFSVADHIGAVAVSDQRGLLIGASWDTESVYGWDLMGALQWRLSGATLSKHGFGIATAPDGQPGVAVQDWKWVGERLLGSGLRRTSLSGGATVSGGGQAQEAESQRSWMVALPVSAELGLPARMVALPTPDGMQLAREGMAVAEGIVHFLPEDLGATNRLFRIPLSELGL